MNFIKLSFFSLLLSVSIIGISSAETVKVSVPEMECESCSRAIEARLKQEKDISGIVVDIKNRVVTLSTVDSAKISDERLREVFKDSGFEAGTIERLN